MQSSTYLNLWVNYGGTWTRVGDALADLARCGDTTGMWMAGYKVRGEFLTDEEKAAREAPHPLDGQLAYLDLFGTYCKTVRENAA